MEEKKKKITFFQILKLVFKRTKLSINSYTVKQVADMLNTNEETVRRWIRSGKLEATLTSKKSGNVISSHALNKFIKKSPKYSSTVTSSILTSPIAMSVVIGGLLGSMLVLMSSKAQNNISSNDVEVFIKKKISSHEKRLQMKKAELIKIQEDIQIEENEIEKYKYALDNLDLQVIANEMNNEKKKEEKNE